MLVDLPNILTTYDGEYPRCYMNQATNTVIPRSKYDSLPDTEKSKCYPVIRAKIKTRELLTHQSIIDGYERVKVGKQNLEVIVERERLKARTDLEKYKFEYDYKKALINFLTKYGIPIHHCKSFSELTVTCNLKTYKFNLEELSMLNLYRFPLQASSAVDISAVYSLGLNNVPLNALATVNNKLELVELKNALGNMVAKQYFEKIKIYVDVYNKLTTYIYNYPLVIENTSVDTVLHLWNNVFNTTEINGKIEVLKLN